MSEYIQLTIIFSRGEQNMNTHLSQAFMKASQIDFRHIRIALVFAVLLYGIFVPSGIPIGGDLGG